MDDESFLDLIYSHWAKTTDAESSYLMPEEYTDHSGRWRVYAVSEDQTRKLVADQMSEADSDFYTAICGCLPDLVRRLHTAIDESARLDTERDEQVGRIAQLEMLVDGLNEDLDMWQRLWRQGVDTTSEAIAERDEANREVEDLLVKIPEELL